VVENNEFYLVKTEELTQEKLFLIKNITELHTEMEAGKRWKIAEYVGLGRFIGNALLKNV
jgi:CMP-N-acetylneuraminic acid synthetase